jgi:hypothetical protein
MDHRKWIDAAADSRATRCRSDEEVTKAGPKPGLCPKGYGLVLLVVGAVFTLVIMTWPLLLIRRIGAIAALTPRADVVAAAVVEIIRANAIRGTAVCDFPVTVALATIGVKTTLPETVGLTADAAGTTAPDGGGAPTPIELLISAEVVVVRPDVAVGVVPVAIPLTTVGAKRALPADTLGELAFVAGTIVPVVGAAPIAPVVASDDAAVVAATAALPVVAGAEPAALRNTA